MATLIDALFLSYFVDYDRWHNDGDEAARLPHPPRDHAREEALRTEEWMKDEIDLVLDGRVYDFSRFLSWVRYGDTTEYARYDPFNITLLAGTYYLDLLTRRGFSVRVANVADRRKLTALGRDYSPRFVLLSTTLMFDGADPTLVPRAVRAIRDTWPEAVVVLGGLLLVSYQKLLSRGAFHDLLRRYGADAYIVSPRGEAALLELLGRKSLIDLLLAPNIPATYIVAGPAVLDPPSREESAWAFGEDYIRWSQLPQTDHLYHAVHMRTARSCAFRCAFCEYPVNQGPLVLAPLEAVERELQELKAIGTVRSVVFTDDTFNVPPERFKELLRVLAAYDLEWYSFFRPQFADKQTAAMMKASGCRGVFAGLESADDGVLRNMNKAARVEQYQRGIEQLKRHDIVVHANFIVGFPGETEESARKIVRFLGDTGVEFCTVCTWAYIPSTPIGARAAEFGLEGLGMEWRHDTMTSKQAHALARAIVGEQKTTIHNAVRGEAWTEFLLYANGFSVADVRTAIGCFNSFLGRDVPMTEVASSAACAELRRVLEARHVPAPTG